MVAMLGRELEGKLWLYVCMVLHTHGAGGVTTTVERSVGILPVAHLGGHAADQDRDKHYGGGRETRSNCWWWELHGDLILGWLWRWRWRWRWRWWSFWLVFN
mgnify:CR=1 FL=1